MQPQESVKHLVDSKKFELLSVLAQQFNAESDTLNDTIDEWNKRLAALNLGLEVWVDNSLADSGHYDQFSPTTRKVERYHDRTLLGYTRVDGQWQLAVKELCCTVEPNTEVFDGFSEVVDADNTKITRLLSASRELRVKAMAKLDNLFDEFQLRLAEGLEGVAKAQKLAEIDKI